MENKDAVSSILTLISNNIAFRRHVAPKFESVLADFTTYSANPNCSCRNKVADFILQNIGDFGPLLELWLQENPQDQNVIELGTSETLKGFSNSSPIEVKDKYIGGRVFTIPKNETDFRAFFQNIVDEGYTFKSFSVLEQDTQWVIFFL